MRYKKALLILLLLLLISLPAVRDLFKPAAFTSHDLTHHIVRLIHMDKILSEGQIPPRWTGELNWGYGYPLFNFNYPLPSLLGVVFHRLGLDYIWSVKMVLAFSMIASIFTAYVLFRLMFGTLGGFLGAVFYVYAPIRFINVYVSATVGNALAFVFVPLVFWGIYGLHKRFEFKYVLGGSLGLAGLILSHNIMAMMFAPVILSFAFVLWLITKNKTAYYWRASALITLGLGMSAFFWLPVIFEKKLILYDKILENFYSAHFPTLKQLIHSPWGYGFSMPGEQDDAMSFQIGLAHIFVFLFSLLIVSKRGIKKSGFWPLYFLSWFILTIFLMLKISLFFWKNLPFLSYVQMSWRFLAITIFTASTLAGWLIKTVNYRRLWFIFLLVLVLYANRNHLRINQVFDPGEEFYLERNDTTTMAAEHLPLWITDPIPKIEPETKIEIASGSGQVTMMTTQSAYLAANVFVDKLSKIVVNQVYYPYWRIKVNHQEIDYDYRSKFARGFPIFFLKPGSYLIEAKLMETPLRLGADLISLGSIVVFVILTILNIKKQISKIHIKN